MCPQLFLGCTFKSPSVKGTLKRTFSKHFKVLKETVHRSCLHSLEEHLDSPGENLDSSADKSTAPRKNRHQREKKRVSCAGGSGACCLYLLKNTFRRNVQDMRRNRPAVLAWKSAAVVALFRCFIPRENGYGQILIFPGCPIYGPLSIGFRRPCTLWGCVLYDCVLRVSAGDSAHRKVTGTHTDGK